jgi:hypothetical protein
VAEGDKSTTDQSAAPAGPTFPPAAVVPSDEVAASDPRSPDAPPWAVHTDVAGAQAQEEQAQLEELQKGVKGDYYVFGGGQSGDGTVALNTHYGLLDAENPIKLPDDEVARLKSSGYKITKVDAPDE